MLQRRGGWLWRGFAPPDETEVLNTTGLYVLPDHQKRGIGTAILQNILDNFDQRILRLTVTRWAYAATFYQNRGFRPTGRPVPPPEPPKAYGITLEQIEMELNRSLC